MDVVYPSGIAGMRNFLGVMVDAEKKAAIKTVPPAKNTCATITVFTNTSPALVALVGLVYKPYTFSPAVLLD